MENSHQWRSASVWLTRPLQAPFAWAPSEHAESTFSDMFAMGTRDGSLEAALKSHWLQWQCFPGDCLHMTATQEWIHKWAKNFSSLLTERTYATAFTGLLIHSASSTLVQDITFCYQYQKENVTAHITSESARREMGFLFLSQRKKLVCDVSAPNDKQPVAENTWICVCTCGEAVCVWMCRGCCSELPVARCRSECAPFSRCDTAFINIHLG